jgi:hypothetical protein
MAQQSGLLLVRNTDLTPYLRLRALPAGLASALLTLGRLIPLRHAILPSMLGSLALQQCLSQGWIEYHFLVFEKEVGGSSGSIFANPQPDYRTT